MMDYVYLIGSCIVIFIFISFAFRKKTLRTKLLYSLGVIVTVIVIFMVVMYIGWNYGTGGNGGRDQAPEAKYVHVINTSDATRYAILSYSYRIANIKKETSDTLYVGKSSETRTAVFELPLQEGDDTFLTDFKLRILDSTYHPLTAYTEREFLQESEAMPASADKRNANLWVIKIK